MDQNEKVMTADSSAVLAEAEVSAKQEGLKAKKAFSRAALSIVLPLLGANAVYYILEAITWNLGMEGVIEQSLVESTNFQFLLSTVPLIVLAYPLFYVSLKKLPSSAPEKKPFKASQVFMFFLIAVAVMCIGNIISTVFAAVLTSGQAENSLESVLTAQQLVPTIYAVLIAPVVEELFFRKLLIDKLSVYGEKWALIFSALCFAMFHMNFYQLLYTFGMGLILGYVYTKSGKLVNTVVMHVGINILGGVLAPIALNALDMEALDKLRELAKAGQEIPEELLNSVLPGLAVYGTYAALYFAMVIAGIVLFIVNRRKLHTEKSELLPTAKEGVPAMLANTGMIVFMAVTVVLMIVQLLLPILTTA